MDEKPKFASRIPDRKEPAEGENRLDSETLKFISLFNSVVKKFKEEHEENSEDFVLKFIEDDTGGTNKSIVNEWLNGHVPVKSFQTGIMSALMELDGRPVVKKDQPPVAPEKPLTPEEKQQLAINSFLSRKALPVKQLKPNKKREENQKKVDDFVEKLRREGKIT